MAVGLFLLLHGRGCGPAELYAWTKRMNSHYLIALGRLVRVELALGAVELSLPGSGWLPGSTALACGYMSSLGCAAGPRASPRGAALLLQDHS